jgi:uncharacterized protein (DUF302 family)
MVNVDDSVETAHRGRWSQLPAGFEDALARLPGALQAEGFGIITQIDLRETFKAKVGVDFRRYRIFGACSPAFALEAVRMDPRVGLLLPCNVVLFEQDDGTAMLGVIDPLEQLGGDDPRLASVARTIAERLRRVAASLALAPPPSVSG